MPGGHFLKIGFWKYCKLYTVRVRSFEHGYLVIEDIKQTIRIWMQMVYLIKALLVVYGLTDIERIAAGNHLLFD